MLVTDIHSDLIKGHHPSVVGGGGHVLFKVSNRVQHKICCRATDNLDRKASG